MTEIYPRAFRSVALVLVFVVGGLAAYVAEWLHARRGAMWTATAAISYPVEWNPIVLGRQRASEPLNAQTFIDGALAALHPNRFASLHDEKPDAQPHRRAGGNEPLVNRLRATVAQAEGRRVHVGFELTSPSRDRAVYELNTIIAAYAAQIRLAVAREALRHAAAVRGMDARFREELGAIVPEFDRLVDHAVKLASHRSGPRNLDVRVQTGVNSQRPEQSSQGAGPHGSNGLPTETRTKLDVLRERRAELLRDRTVAHPDVRHVDAMIAEAEKELEELPAPTPHSGQPPLSAVPRPLQAASVAMGGSSTESPAASARSLQWMELFQAIQALQDRIDALSQFLEKTRRPELASATGVLRNEDLTVHWAEQADLTAADVSLWALIGASVAAGLVFAAGTGMVWIGIRIDTPLESADEIRRRLALPVIGTIVAEAMPVEKLRCAAVARWKWPCVVAGSAVITAYLVFVLMPLLA